jgi:hypothetical protein
MSVLPRAPGWYRDPLDRTRMRHWSGMYWDVPQRRLPPWVLGTAAVVLTPQRLGRGGGPQLEGPVNVAVLPVQARSSARVRAARLGRPAPVSPHQLAAGTLASGRGPLGLSSRAAARGRRRFPAPLTVSGAVVIAALLVVAGFVSFSRSPSTVARVSSDAAYIQAANAACTSTLGAITNGRAAATGPTATPAEVVASNRVLRSLASKLQGLPAAAAVAGSTRSWFADWTAYESARTSEAAYVAAHRTLSTPARHEENALDTTTRAAATAANSWAQSNSLGECLLASPPAGGTHAF